MPRIVQIISQLCIADSQYTTTVECVGVDDKGQKWRFYHDNHWTWDDDGGTVTLGHFYGFKKVKPRWLTR